MDENEECPSNNIKKKGIIRASNASEAKQKEKEKSPWRQGSTWNKNGHQDSISYLFSAINSLRARTTALTPSLTRACSEGSTLGSHFVSNLSGCHKIIALRKRSLGDLSVEWKRDKINLPTRSFVISAGVKPRDE